MIRPSVPAPETGRFRAVTLYSMAKNAQQNTTFHGRKGRSPYFPKGRQLDPDAFQEGLDLILESDRARSTTVQVRPQD